MATDVLVKNDFKKKKKKKPKKTGLWDRVKNLLEKKLPGLSDSGMASGGLRLNVILK